MDPLDFAFRHALLLFDKGVAEIHVCACVGRNQWYHFGVGAPPILILDNFSGDVDVHWGQGKRQTEETKGPYESGTL